MSGAGSPRISLAKVCVTLGRGWRLRRAKKKGDNTRSAYQSVDIQKNLDEGMKPPLQQVWISSQDPVLLWKISCRRMPCVCVCVYRSSGNAGRVLYFSTWNFCLFQIFLSLGPFWDHTPRHTHCMCTDSLQVSDHHSKSVSQALFWRLCCCFFPCPLLEDFHLYFPFPVSWQRVEIYMCVSVWGNDGEGARQWSI